MLHGLLKCNRQDAKAQRRKRESGTPRACARTMGGPTFARSRASRGAGASWLRRWRGRSRNPVCFWAWRSWRSWRHGGFRAC